MKLNELKFDFYNKKLQIIRVTSNFYMLESCNTLIDLSNEQQTQLTQIIPELKKQFKLIERLANQQILNIGTFAINNCKLNGTVQKTTEGFNVFLQETNNTIETNNESFNTNDELEKVKRLQRIRQDHFSKITHDIKLPLTEIVGTTYLLNQFVTNPKGQSYLKALSQAAKSLDIMLNDLVSFSKNESLNLTIVEKPFKLRSLVNAVVKSFEFKTNESDIPIYVFIDKNVNDDLMGDATRISQIIYNLLDNALKFTKKGSITVSVSQSKNTMVKFEVSDTGIGIPKEKLNYIFETYQQARKEDANTGFGIGLSIVKQLVELLGGTINANSAIGKGSNFIFELPLNKEIK